MGKVKEMFMEFDELVESDSFFSISIRNYKKANHLSITALGDYSWELDMYLRQNNFAYSQGDQFQEYYKGDTQISLI